MKTNIAIQGAALALLLSTLTSQLSTCFAQGALTPPGAPTPTMKTLDQIESRIPITNVTAGIFINNPGSYYLTTNLTGGFNVFAISVNANDVKIDLRGWTLTSSGGASARGIHGNAALTNVSIYNGSLVGWSNSAVSLNSVVGAHVENIQVRTSRGGIIVGNNGCVQHCQVVGIGASIGFGGGRGAIFDDCIADQFITGFSTGDNSILTRCIAVNNTSDGIDAGLNANISSCLAVSNNFGIFALQSSRLENNSANNNLQDGISPSGDSLVLNNICSGNASKGINVAGFNNRLDGNQLGSNGVNGIFIGAGSTNNIVVHNASHRNGANTDAANYSIVAGNDVGPIGNAVTNTSPWANLR
jgi:hypothetical protein